MNYQLPSALRRHDSFGTASAPSPGTPNAVLRNGSLAGQQPLASFSNASMLMNMGSSNGDAFSPSSFASSSSGLSSASSSLPTGAAAVAAFVPYVLPSRGENGNEAMLAAVDWAADSLSAAKANARHPSMFGDLGSRAAASSYSSVGDESDGGGGGGGYVDPQSLFNRFTPGFLSTPVGVKPLANVTFRPRDKTLCYKPSIEENTADDVRHYRPLSATHVSASLDLDNTRERTYPVRRFAQASGTTANRVPSYVPFAVRKLGHDAIRWEPPAQERTTASSFQTTVATVVEADIPPTVRRNVNEEHELQRRLVAYDDSEAFGFLPRPIDTIEALDQILDAFYACQERGEVPLTMQPQMLVHNMKVYLFHGLFTAAAWFQPATAVRGTVSAGWQHVDFEDASRFVYSAVPPSSCTIVPIPNQPYMVTATPKTLFLLDLAESCWHALPMVGLHDFVTFGWMHVVDDKTLYVVSGTHKHMHGIVPLQEPVQEVDIMKRGGTSKLFDPEFQSPLQGTRLRGAPCSELLVPLFSIPGVAYHSVKGEGHTWLFYFNTVARKFVPWQRLEFETFRPVCMKDHLELDSWTVLFFTERLVRTDLNKEMAEKLQPKGKLISGAGVGGSSSSKAASGEGHAAPGNTSTFLSSNTQIVLKATHRLVIKNPPKEDPAVMPDGGGKNAPNTTSSSSSASAAGGGASPLSSPLKQLPTAARTAAAADAAVTSSPTLKGNGVGVANRVVRLTSFTRLGATGPDFASRMALAQVPERDSTVLIRLRIREVALLCPMFDRCIAVIPFDKKAFVSVEVDRRLHARKLIGEDIEDVDDLDTARL